MVCCGYKRKKNEKREGRKFFTRTFILFLKELKTDKKLKIVKWSRPWVKFINK